jgi:hypothetical protein
MIVAVVHALAELSPALNDARQASLSNIKEVMDIIVNVVFHVIPQAIKEKAHCVHGVPFSDDDLKTWIKDQMGRPEYRLLEKVDPGHASHRARGQLGTRACASIGVSLY